jgi:hypothetical protein
VYSAEAGPKQAAKPKKEKVTTEAPKPESSADTALIEKTVLGFMDKNNGEITNTAEFCDNTKIAADQLEPVLKSLLVDEYVVLAVIERKVIELTAEGLGYAQNGSPEYQFVTQMAVGEKVDMAEMEKRCGA